MPERNIEFGKYQASGINGARAVARQLDDLAGFIATPVTTRRGWTARLHYLTRSQKSLDAARDAGLTATARTLRAWQLGTRSPSKANLAKIEDAYRQVRRTNVARHLAARLRRDGRGTQIEIHPVSQTAVAQERRRVMPHRAINVRRWEPIVGAWAASDRQGLQDAWVEVIVDLGSQWGQYEYVTHVGFAA